MKKMKTIKRKISAPFLITIVKNFEHYFFAVRTAKNIQLTNEYKQALKLLDDPENEVTSLVITPYKMINEFKNEVNFKPKELKALNTELNNYQFKKQGLIK